MYQALFPCCLEQCKLMDLFLQQAQEVGAIITVKKERYTEVWYLTQKPRLKLLEKGFVVRKSCSSGVHGLSHCKLADLHNTKDPSLTMS